MYICILNLMIINLNFITMRKILFLVAIATLFLSFNSYSQKKLLAVEKYDKALSHMDVAPLKSGSYSVSGTKAPWDVAFTFNASDGAHVGIETDGTNFYTSTWNAGDFSRYTMDGTFVETFTISGVSGLRDLTYDGTYFYGSNSTMTIYVMDLANKALVNTISATCTGVSAIRHIAYDPTLDSGNGGFWIGNWSDLGAVSMTGTELIASTVTTLESCYGTAYDPYSDPANPCLWLFQQSGSSKVNFHQFDINTMTMTGVVHDCAGAPGVGTDVLAGGACLYTSSGIAYLVGNIQQTPNLIAVYELAVVANPTAPGKPTNLTATAAGLGALNADVSWVNPSVDVNGDALAELTTIELFINDSGTAAYTNNSPVVGGTENQNITVTTPGNYNFKVYGTNSAGAGLIASVNAWIGEDVPAAPANVVLTATDMTITLTWDAPTLGLHNEYFTGTGVTYDVVRYPGEVVVSTAQTALTFSETLTEANSYYYAVKASNPSGEGGVGTSNTLLVGDVLHFDFETGAPAGSELIDGACGWLFGNAGGSSYFPIPDHGNYAYVNDDVCNGDMSDVWMILPPVDFTGINNPWMSFENVRRSDIFTIKASTNGSTWNDVVTLSSANISAWQEELIDLTAYANEPFVLIAFHYNDDSGWGYGWAVDDVMMPGSIVVITCPKPENLTVSAITTSSASLGWTETGAATLWNIEWGEIGFTQGSGTMITGVDVNPYTLNGLSSGTMYDFYVQSDCGSGDNSLWAGPYTFATECEIATSLDEGFEDAVPPLCWITFQAGAGTKTWQQNTSVYLEGVASAAASWESSGGENQQWLVTGRITVPTSHNLTFYARDYLSSEYNSVLRIMISTDADPNNTGAYTQLLELAESDVNSSSFTKFDVNLSSYAGQDVFIAFVMVDNNGDRWYLDVVKLEPRVPVVVSLTPEADAVDVALDAEVSVTFDVDLTAVDLTGITITPDPGNVSASVNNAVLTIAHDDFTYNTTYTVLVPAGAVSDGITPTTGLVTWSFKTMLDPALCNTPTNLVVSNVLENEATVTWTEVGAGTQWRVKYGATGFNPETEGEEKVVDVQTATLTELTEMTTYEVYVQALCPGDVTSDWAGPVSFTTACVAITTLPYLEEFEGAFPTECWTFVNNHADPTSNWHIDNYPDTGDPALNILWSDENMMDEWAISPVFDLSGITGEIALTFDFLMSYEYQVDPTNGADVMVKVTTDNGTTWTKIWQEEDYGTFENWTWYTATLPFSTYVGESNVKFAFHYLGNDGAQVMIDNVELDYATSVNDNVTNLVSVYPNPSNGIVNVQVSETSVITIVDLAGRVVATYNANANETLSFTQATGVYVVKVESNGQVSNHKLIIQ